MLNVKMDCRDIDSCLLNFSGEQCSSFSKNLSLEYIEVVWSRTQEFCRILGMIYRRKLFCMATMLKREAKGTHAMCFSTQQLRQLGTGVTIRVVNHILFKFSLVALETQHYTLYSDDGQFFTSACRCRRLHCVFQEIKPWHHRNCTSLSIIAFLAPPYSILLWHKDIHNTFSNSCNRIFNIMLCQVWNLLLFEKLSLTVSRAKK